MAGDCGSSCPVAGGFYSYDPNLGGNAFLLAAFALLAVVVPYLGFRSRTPLFSSTLTIGFLAELIGFVGRVLLHSARDDQSYFFLFLFGTVLGPTFISAAIFILLPHVLGIYGEPISPFKPLAAGLVFYSLISIALIIELIGIVLVAYESSNVSRNSGAKITVAGLAMQTALLLACSGLHFWFTIGLSTRRGSLDAKHHQVYTSSAFTGLIMGMHIANVLIIAYSIYRIVEFAGYVSGTLFQNQSAFMVVGGAIPLIAGIILTAFHPGPIFGDAWAATTPHGLKRRGRPPPIQHPNGHDTHHRYDPNIRKQLSPMSQRTLRSSLSPPELPAGSPGLPLNPRPNSKPSSPRSPKSPANLPSLLERERRSSEPSDRKVTTPKAMVDSEELW